MPEVTEHHADFDGQPVFWRSAPSDTATPLLYLHGVPSSADEWTPFLAAGGGIAPDLPGFGRAGKRADGAYTMEGYDAWLERFLDHVEVDRFRLLVHDWGGVGLLLAQRFPERVERLVVVNCVPFLPGYKWHKYARLWQTRGVGELFMGSVNRVTVKQLSREFNATKGPMPQAWVDDVMRGFDLGTQRAILRLYRTSPPEKLALAGLKLAELDCPSLVLWGDKDPFIDPSFGDAYAKALGAEIRHYPGAGHWPWLDQPEIVGAAVEFLTA